ncbi:MAG: alpha/beta hydrolase-fold protein [Rubripirellula sp.]
MLPSIRFVFFASIVITVSICGNASAQTVTAKPKSKKKPPAPFAWVNPLPAKHHLAVSHATFVSPSMNIDVGYTILLPPGYETETTARFPTLYYLHGGRPGSETKSLGLVPHWHDAMAGGKVAPMIVVMVNGGPVSHYNLPDKPMSAGADVFINELIPHIDATYRTIADRSGRAIEGFSQGGRGTMRLSLRYPELFCSAAPGGGGYETEKRISQSGGFENDSLKFAEGDNVWDLARKYAAESKHPSVTWMIYVGTKGFNYENNLAYMSFLDSLGIPYTRLVVPEVPHSAVGIYEKQGLEIMRFHAVNFTR